MHALPREDVRDRILHMYLLVDGRIDVRLNIASYVSGDERECWDREIRRPNYWAVCTGPVSKPCEAMLAQGFQGFRYVADLW